MDFLVDITDLCFIEASDSIRTFQNWLVDWTLYWSKVEEMASDWWSCRMRVDSDGSVCSDPVGSAEPTWSCRTSAEHLLVFSSRRKSKGGLVMNNKQEVCFRLTIKQKLIWISSKRLFTNMFLSYYSSNNPTTKPAICTGLYTWTALLYLYYMKLTIPLYQ